MKALTLFIILLSLHTVCAEDNGYALRIFVNDEIIAWQSDAVDENGRLHPNDTGYAVVIFENGTLELNLEDWNTFDYAHVLGVHYEKKRDGSYRFATTVRHHDQGWDNYANAFEIIGENVTHGLRVLAHPHDHEQPFTRSLSGVEAHGSVLIEARDNVEEVGGSRITLNLDNLPPNYQLRYQLLR